MMEIFIKVYSAIKNCCRGLYMIGGIHLFRTLMYGIFFYLYLFKITPIYFKIKKLEKTGDTKAHMDEIRKITYRWGHALLKRAKVELKVSGTEKIPEGPVLFVSNHQSYFDIPVFFASVNKQFGFVAKSDLYKIPVFSKWIEVIQSVEIDRGDARQSLKAIEEGILLLEKGYSLVIFPEGTRSRSSKMQEFKKGSLRLATKPGIPIVPVTISGTYKLFEEKMRIEPGAVSFTVHDPIDTKSLTKEEINELTDKVRSIIENGLN